MTPTMYMARIVEELTTSNLVAAFDVIEEWVEPDQGYIRVRAQLANDDFLELAEYFVLSGKVCVTERYSYQWMDKTRKHLRKRWDNVEHYPDLPGFPHHVHLADGRVEPGKCLSILDLLKMLALELHGA